ncbi:COG2426 family protein [Treponema sp. R6D11]
MSSALYAFFVSMLPIVELRGGLPIGVGLGLNIPEALLVSVIGNLLPIPFILIFITKFLEWLRKKQNKLGSFARWLDAKGKKGAEKIGEYEKWGLLIFVAIPLPGTGAWTGALAASALGMKFKDSIFSIAIGVIVAGLIMSALSGIFIYPFVH